MRTVPISLLVAEGSGRREDGIWLVRPEGGLSGS